ncbi:MAG: MotA/TolQ/ExbB proton channel family protein [Bacteroidales bacterium]|jgi:biopolymer transport protein ExbB|nr:MotA/TolQ/ExbB proton channel family protein [Bacteroidales bacterium]
MNPLLLIQNLTEEALPILSEVAQETTTVESIRFFEMAVKGGWLMIPLLLLSGLAIYIFIDRFRVLRAASKEDPTFMNRIRDYIVEGNTASAINLCKKTDNPSSRMIEKGISRIGRPMNDVQIAIENVGNIEVSKMERGMSILASVAGGAPMIGFLGTVMGMVRAFFDMSSAGNNVDISVLSSGIYTAMVTTVAGLIVGICAFFAYNFLISRVNNIVSRMESKTMEFMDLLNEPIKK